MREKSLHVHFVFVGEQSASHTIAKQSLEQLQGILRRLDRFTQFRLGHGAAEKTGEQFAQSFHLLGSVPLSITGLDEHANAHVSADIAVLSVVFLPYREHEPVSSELLRQLVQLRHQGDVIMVYTMHQEPPIRLSLIWRYFRKEQKIHVPVIASGLFLDTNNPFAMHLFAFTTNSREAMQENETTVNLLMDAILMAAKSNINEQSVWSKLWNWATDPDTVRSALQIAAIGGLMYVSATVASPYLMTLASTANKVLDTGATEASMKNGVLPVVVDFITGDPTVPKPNVGEDAQLYMQPGFRPIGSVQLKVRLENDLNLKLTEATSVTKDFKDSVAWVVVWDMAVDALRSLDGLLTSMKNRRETVKALIVVVIDTRLGGTNAEQQLNDLVTRASSREALGIRIDTYVYKLDKSNIQAPRIVFQKLIVGSTDLAQLRATEAHDTSVPASTPVKVASSIGKTGPITRQIKKREPLRVHIVFDQNMAVKDTLSVTQRLTKFHDDTSNPSHILLVYDADRYSNSEQLLAKVQEAIEGHTRSGTSTSLLLMVDRSKNNFIDSVQEKLEQAKQQANLLYRIADKNDNAEIVPAWAA